METYFFKDVFRLRYYYTCNFINFLNFIKLANTYENLTFKLVKYFMLIGILFINKHTSMCIKLLTAI